ncbi:YdeI/OmpD-associated family protein [Winogradskyella sp. PG-2]|uniref:YdeI/OmpD-associated family protein n=1 Tax=Winogradskyella sp. PG-2 TaxID=754409 RepID=UPI00045878E1|nr:YdeI/OmpD-associated family protein [Winogradskyella sp. PG-2]BAO76779.1 hypothetical protein WPG_2549 [Winogradskyella sp. PG-2]
MEYPELYFERDIDFDDWLLTNHDIHKAVYIVFYKLETKMPTMRWEEAVKVALCFGWIDSTVKSLGGRKCIQYFSPRNPKSTWSALNKKYIIELDKAGLIQESGWKLINLAKETGKWTEMDDVENGLIPKELKDAFDKNERAFENYQKFSKGYRKSYLSWLHSAKREATRQKRIAEIIKLCDANIKSRDTW